MTSPSLPVILILIIIFFFLGTSESHTPSSNTSGSDVKHDQDNQEINGKVDVALILKLQHKLAEVEREKARIQSRLDEIDSSPRSEKAKFEAESTFRISELEMSNSELKSQLFELQNSINEGKRIAQEYSYNLM